LAEHAIEGGHGPVQVVQGALPVSHGHLVQGHRYRSGVRFPGLSATVSEVGFAKHRQPQQWGRVEARGENVFLGLEACIVL
jgi:hypothetical protein